MARYQKQHRQARRFSVKDENDDTIQVSLQEHILGHLSEWIPGLVRAEIREFLGRDSGEHQADTQEAGVRVSTVNGKPYRNGEDVPNVVEAGLRRRS